MFFKCKIVLSVKCGTTKVLYMYCKITSFLACGRSDRGKQFIEKSCQRIVQNTWYHFEWWVQMRLIFGPHYLSNKMV